MSDAKHTPGPWGPARELNGKGYGWQAGPCWIGEKSYSEEAAANARLVAAAPELLAALELIANTDPIDAALDPQRAIRVARHAISKAEGSK